MLFQDQKDGVSSVCQLIGDDLVSRITFLVSSKKYAAHTERVASSDGDATLFEKDSSAIGDAATGANEGDAAQKKRGSEPGVGMSPGERDAGKESHEGDAAYEMGVALCAWESLASVCNVPVTMRYISSLEPRNLNPNPPKQSQSWS